MGSLEAKAVLVRFRLIGSAEAVDACGKDLLPPSRKPRALLSYMALNPGQWVPRSRLTRLLWDRVPEAQGRASLRQALHELARAMGPVFGQVVETERERLRIRPEAIRVDALLGATPGGFDAQRELNVFSGSLLLDGLDNLSDEFDNWLTVERQKFEERIRRSNEDNVRGLVGDAQPHPQRAALARKAVATDPTNEEAVRELMRSLTGAGQRAQAVLEYERCRAVLRSRLDIEPAPETQQLYRSLRRATVGKELSPAPPAEGSSPQPVPPVREDICALERAPAGGERELPARSTQHCRASLHRRQHRCGNG